MSDLIEYRVAEHIATITINRPERRNAMTFAMNRAFGQRIRDATTDDDVRVLIVTGAGGAFCAGTDLSDLDEQAPDDRFGSSDAAESGDRYWPLLQCPKPVIAAIDGPAVGMGAEFTSHCDIRIASSNCRIAWIFARRGLVPDTGAGSWLLPRLIGLQKSMELLYTGRFVDAAEAREMGYVLEVVEPDKLMDTSYALARQILEGSPFAQRLIKSLVYDGLSKGAGEHVKDSMNALRECFHSEDHQEGVKAFLEKREPRFVGR